MNTMEIATRRRNLAATFGGLAVFGLLIAAAIAIEPGLISKLQGNIEPSKQATFDLGHYINLARDPKCWAFYPLWPLTIRIMGPLWGTSLSKTAVALSTLFFALSLILGHKWLLNNAKTSFSFSVAWLLLILSPMNIFMLNGYSEALFALLTWTSILIITSLFDLVGNGNGNCEQQLQPLQKKKFLLLAAFLLITSSLIGYSRPALPQTLGGCIAGIAAELIYQKSSGQRIKLNKLTTPKIALITLLGCAAGYAIYGFQCINDGGTFFQPFTSQSTDWDKSLGLRPWFLLSSRSPIFDLWGLYYPVALLMMGAAEITPYISRVTNSLSLQYQWYGPLFLAYPPLAIIIAMTTRITERFTNRSLKKRTKQQLVDKSSSPLKNEKYRYLFFYCIAFSASHSIIVFLTQENYLYSLGRYIFGQPYLYVAISIYLPIMQQRSPNKARLIASSAIAASALLLLSQALRYGLGEWIG